MSTPYRLREEPARDLVPAGEPATTTTALGRLRSVHTAGKTVRRGLLGAASVALVLGVMTLAWPGAIGVVLVAFVFASAIALWVGLAVLLGLDVTVYVHENGLRVERSARPVVRVPFDAIRALYVHRRAEWSIELADRAVFVPMKVGNDRRLEAIIEQEIERPVLADAHRALASGEHLTFGAITLELDGVRHRGDLLPWWDLDCVRATDDAFVFIRKATEHSFVVLPTSTVPFPRVLVALLARRTRVDAGDAFWSRFVAT